MGRSNNKFIILCKCINNKYQCHMSACCTYHRPTYLELLAAIQEPYKKAYLLMKNEKFRRMGEQAEKRQKE